jgi:phosphoglycolate phosphatase
VELPRDFEKPNPQGALQICRDFGVDPKQVLVIGDSLHKDIAVARKIGAVDCWAEYGTYVSTEYRERLDIVSANAITRRHAASLFEGEGKNLEPTHSLSNFGQLLKLVA